MVKGTVALHFEVKLARIRKLSNSTFDFRFVRSDDGAVEYEPGQFFRFIFKDSEGEFERSYSLCNFDNPDSKSLDLLISTVKGGRASELLFNCEAGITASVSGPFGRLLVPEKLPERLFLVATSVGIAPFMPMLEQLSPALLSNRLEVHFLYGTRDPEEFIYGDKLRHFAAVHEPFRLSVCYSREMPVKNDTRDDEFKGYVQERLQQLCLTPETDHLLLCGNPKMIDDTYSWLKTKGFGVKQVVREKYVFAKAPGRRQKPAMNEEQMKLLAEKMKKYQS